ncbi:methyltransferase domain-containing protein [candidate division KSB3 bacterium]|uniref:Methyltransferase domain-containing protein n=1 Tax=candidate division KSB3 bacterium TaxID=2044937 RepID=A0A9D5JTQ3_9BACT|nr:methyltransferase domain-containing protein [candidate division KSB3 bacterium]MBD3324063.1 methyltransferase domain-containing protein [candidate division KSB3 bacterium]
MGSEHSVITDRVSNLSYRLMTLTFKIIDFFFPPEKPLEEFGLKPGLTVMDYGCGPGRHLKAASQLVGPTGKVYAVDIHDLAIQAVTELIEKEQLNNVEPVLVHGYTTPLPAASIDLLYALDMFHGVHDPDRLQQEWHRLVKPGGTLILEDGHQSRAKTRESLRRAGVFEIQDEQKQYVRCRPVKSTNN